MEYVFSTNKILAGFQNSVQRAWAPWDFKRWGKQTLHIFTSLLTSHKNYFSACCMHQQRIFAPFTLQLHLPSAYIHRLISQYQSCVPTFNYLIATSKQHAFRLHRPALLNKFTVNKYVCQKARNDDTAHKSLCGAAYRFYRCVKHPHYLHCLQ